jgi:hypothetical protein
MRIGTRILYPEETDYWNAELVQISVYRGMQKNIETMMNCARACKEAGIRYVIHPVRYSLLETEMRDEVTLMAECSDLALILHDERNPDGERLSGVNEKKFRNAIMELQSVTSVSFENATNTGDVKWFWDNFAESITLDIGHVESAGLDSVAFVESLDKAVIKNIHFVHMHRNNGLRGGITDHWPLSSDCREVSALKSLMNVHSQFSVFLEINEIEEIDQSLNILRSLRDEF